MNFKEFKQELLNDPEFKKVYEDKTDLFFETSEMVEEMRAMAGLTQTQLAEKVGTKQSSIARVESGAALPSLSFLKKIAEALGTYLIPPKFASLEKLRTDAKTETQTFKEPMKLDTSNWPISVKTKTTGRNSGQKSLIKQLTNQ